MFAQAPRVTRTGTYGPGRATMKRVHRVIPYLIQHTQHCHRPTISIATLKHTPVKTRAPRSTRPSGLRCVLAAGQHTAEQYSKTGRRKPRKHLPSSSLSWNTRQDFLKNPVFEKLLWKPSEDASQRSFFNKMSLPI